MSIEQSYGFKSAQRAYENATPFDSDCACDPLYLCERCEEYSMEEGACSNCKDADYDEEFHGLGICKQIDREDNEFGSSSSCRQHGGCGGCHSRWCEDCGGEYEPDYDD